MKKDTLLVIPKYLKPVEDILLNKPEWSSDMRIVTNEYGRFVGQIFIDDQMFMQTVEYDKLVDVLWAVFQICYDYSKVK